MSKLYFFTLFLSLTSFSLVFLPFFLSHKPSLSTSFPLSSVFPSFFSYSTNHSFFSVSPYFFLSSRFSLPLFLLITRHPFSLSSFFFSLRFTFLFPLFILSLSIPPPSISSTFSPSLYFSLFFFHF